MRAAYMSQNSGQRAWLYVMGVLLLLAVPALRWGSERFELGPLRDWPNGLAEIGLLPDLKQLEKDRLTPLQESEEERRYGITVVYW